MDLFGEWIKMCNFDRPLFFSINYHCKYIYKLRLNSDTHKGFVPLPAQFIRAVAFNIIVKQKRLKENFIEFDLRSRWHLNRNQGLQDDFEK